MLRSGFGGGAEGRGDGISEGEGEGGGDGMAGNGGVVGGGDIEGESEEWTEGCEGVGCKSAHPWLGFSGSENIGNEGERDIRYCVGAGYATGEDGVEVCVVSAEVGEDVVETFNCFMFRAQCR